VTLLEALPMQETIEAIDELQDLGLPIGSVIVNRNIPATWHLTPAAKAAEGGRRRRPVRGDRPRRESRCPTATLPVC